MYESPLVLFQDREVSVTVSTRHRVLIQHRESLKSLNGLPVQELYGGGQKQGLWEPQVRVFILTLLALGTGT